MAAPTPELRSLTAADREAFRSFSCGGDRREPWAETLDELIRYQLADELSSSRVSGVGLWLDDHLVGIAAWSASPDDVTSWRCHLLAVQNGFRWRGYGARLKREVLAAAAREGVRAVVSQVHYDNAAMEAINRALGATAKRLDRDWVRWITPVRV